jgi:hypothetical protein
MREFKVYINENFSSFALDIYFVMEQGDRTWIAKPMELDFEEEKEGHVIHDPSLRLGHRQSKEFLAAISKALHGHGIRPDEESINEGKLKATTYHLEDLRKLLKLKRE